MIKYIIDEPEKIVLQCIYPETTDVILDASIVIKDDTAVWADSFRGKMTKSFMKVMKEDFEIFVSRLKQQGVRRVVISVSQADLVQGNSLRRIFKFPEFKPMYHSVRYI